MKKIFALQGKSNSGKTMTFYHLGQMLIDSGYVLREGNLLERLARRPRRGDFWAIFEKDGVVIGIVSSGDMYKIVKGQLDMLTQTFHCEIILCTCRSFDRKSPGTVAAINAVEGYGKEFIRKEEETDPSKFDAINKAYAEILLQKLDSQMI